MRLPREKRPELYTMMDKAMLFVTKNGKLHGIKSLGRKGAFILLYTHCDQEFKIRDSRNSKTARWLRNGYVHRSCKSCDIPRWKVAKFKGKGYRKKKEDRSGRSLGSNPN